MPSQSSISNPILKLQTVQNAVVDHIRNMILNRELIPEQRLVQDDLANQLGVSRTPVREALNILAHEGFVEISPYKGASVADFSIEKLEDIYAVRIALESYATFLAAKDISDNDLDTLADLMDKMNDAFKKNDSEGLVSAHNQFHTTIYTAARRQRLHELCEQNLKISMVYQRLALSMGRGAKDPVIEHQDLLETLKNHNADAAGEMMRNHLEFTMNELLTLFTNADSENQ